MKLSLLHRRLIETGSTTSLLFPYEEGKPVEGACCVVLAWEQSRRISDQHGNVTVVPARPVHWIEVTDVKRHRKGDWQVRFDVLDVREHPRFLGRGSDYTSSRFRAIDDAECVPAKDQQRMADEASHRDHLVRMEQVAARRTERWRFTRERRKATQSLRSAA